MEGSFEEERRERTAEAGSSEQGERSSATQTDSTIQELAEALRLMVERMSADHSARHAQDMLDRLTEQTDESSRRQTQAIDRIAERLGDLSRQAAASGDELDLKQQRAVLKYDAFRTALGREGATSLLIGRIHWEQGDDSERLVVSSAQQLPGHTHRLVTFDSRGNVLDEKELTRNQRIDAERGEQTDEWSATLSNHGRAVAHFEVWDHAGPRWFGLIQPHAPVRATALEHN